MRRSYIFVQCVAALVSVSMLTTSAFAQQKTAKACEAEWRANKATIQSSGKKKKDFITECRTGAPQTTAAAPAAPAAPPPQAAPANPPAQAAAPAPAAPSTTAAARTEENAAQARKRARTAARTPATPAAGQYATEAEAKSHCPDDTVVWANTRSKVYHFAGSRTYGKTRSGAYMCEKDTVAAGIRSAKNEKRK